MTDTVDKILEERGKDYGSFSQNMAILDDLMKPIEEQGAYLRMSREEKHAIYMTMLKLSRILNGSTNPDNWKDMAGYLKLVADGEDSQPKFVFGDGIASKNDYEQLKKDDLVDFKGYDSQGRYHDKTYAENGCIIHNRLDESRLEIRFFITAKYSIEIEEHFATIDYADETTFITLADTSSDDNSNFKVGDAVNVSFMSFGKQMKITNTEDNAKIVAVDNELKEVTVRYIDANPRVGEVSEVDNTFSFTCVTIVNSDDAPSDSPYTTNQELIDLARGNTGDA